MMRIRKARRGKYAGKDFWGCIRYPSCKGIIDIEDLNRKIEE